MSKVLVDRVELEEAAKWLEVHSSSSGSAEAFAAEALREAIAQPAEAEGVQLRRYTPISQGDHMPAMNSCDQGGWVRHSDYLAALSAVTAERDLAVQGGLQIIAERDMLRDAAGKAIAWLDAEQNGSGVGINRRIKLCRDAENSLRSAMAAKEA